MNSHALSVASTPGECKNTFTPATQSSLWGFKSGGVFPQRRREYRSASPNNSMKENYLRGCQGDGGVSQSRGRTSREVIDSSSTPS